MTDPLQLISREQIAGNIIRKILLETDLTDIAPGSQLSILIEGIASVEFQIQLSILKILEASNVDSLTGVSLDKKAVSIGLPNGIGGYGRLPASQSSGSITISSAFSKVASKPYAGKPAPFAGTLTLYLEDASGFNAAGGSVYLGRGTVDRFEGPITYTSAVNSGSYWTVQLAVPLTKNHPYTDTVIYAQGGDRTVKAGSQVQVKANSNVTAVTYTTDLALLIADGESQGTVSVTCTQFGELGNALAGAITQFVNPPYTGATVTNPSSFINGSSTESDEGLRTRIKNYPSTLSRGTKDAILAAIQGAIDSTTGRTIVSSTLVEPIAAGDSAKVYIDDGTGLEPTFSGQSYELLLKSASGQETQFQTAQVPITAVLALGANSGPFQLQGGQTLTIVIDGVSETYSVTAANYKNLNSATGYEVVRDFNSQSSLVGFRTTGGGSEVVAFDISGTSEILQVLPGTVQVLLGLPTSTLRPIFVYKNGSILSFRGRTATLSSQPYPWGMTTANLHDLPVLVDGVLETFTVTDTDFTQFNALATSATLAQWATVLATKIAGVSFTVVGDVLVWSSNKIFSASGSLSLPLTRSDGTTPGWFGGMWLATQTLSSAGAPQDYEVNRFTGQIGLLSKPAPTSTIEIGSRDTRASIKSTSAASGLFSLDSIPSGIGTSRIVLGFDGTFAVKNSTLASNLTATPSFPDATNAYDVVRLTAGDTGLFEAAVIGDYMFLSQDQAYAPSWGSLAEGLYQIKAKGANLSAVDVAYSSIPGTVVSFLSTTPFSVYPGSTRITVTHTGHGMASGELVTTLTSTAVGGLSGAALSVTNVPIVVIDSATFYFNVATPATTYGSGTFPITTNKILVNLANHGFVTGSALSTTASGGFGGISSGNMAMSYTPVYVIDNSNFYILATGTSATGTSVFTGTMVATYKADAWVEFEIASTQNATWASIVGTPISVVRGMVSLFQSTTVPQLVDFGSLTTSTVDQIVASISSQVAGGTAYKVDPQTVGLRSNDYVAGTCAVLAVVGNASNLFSTEVSSTIQAHTASSASSYAASGFPVVTGIVVPTSTSSTKSYLLVDRDMTDITNTAGVIQQSATGSPVYPIGFEELWLTGRQESLTARVYNNTNSSPYAGFLRNTGVVPNLSTSDSSQTSTSGAFDRYSNFGMRLSDLPLTESDKMVVAMDLDTVGKTVSIPMAKRALIQGVDAITGGGVGSVVNMSLSDPDDINPNTSLPRPFFDTTSIYKGFDFSDFKVISKSIGVYRDSTGHNVPATGSFVAIPAAVGTSIETGDTFTLNDGANTAVVFEFTNTGTYASGHVPVAYTPGARATGSLTAISAVPGSTIEMGDTFTLSDPVNGSQVFEFTNTGIVGAGHVAVNLVAGAYASGSLTVPVAGSAPATGINYGDTFTLNDGTTTKVFEFNATTTSGGHTLVAILATDTPGDIKTAMIAAINGSGLTITATSGINYVVNLTNTVIGSGGNTAMSQSLSNSQTLYPTGMTGGVNYPTAAAVKAAIITAIGSTIIAILATSGAGSLINLVQTTYGTTGNLAITQSLSHSQTLTPVGFTGGIAEATAATIKAAMISAINGVNQITHPLTMSAADGGGLVILLTNTTPLQANYPYGNVALLQSLSHGATLSPSGMSGGTVKLVAVGKGLVLRSTSFGGQTQLVFSMRYPSAPSQAAVSISHTNDFLNGRNRTNLIATLPSGSLVAGSTYSSGAYTVVAIPDGNLSLLRFSAATLNTASQYVPGNLLNVTGVSALAGSYKIVSAAPGSVEVLAPGGLGTFSTLFDASLSPLTSFPLAGVLLTDVATAIGNYLPANPVATVSVLGTGLGSYNITNATYITYENGTVSPYSDIPNSLTWNSFYCKNSGVAGIFQYDSSNPSLNGIKTLVQSVDSLFPTVSDATGTTYSPVGEEVYVLPSNSYTTARWMNFNAVSSLPVIASVELMDSARRVQLSSLQDGASGAVMVSGVTANALSTFVAGNSTTNENSTTVDILWSDAKTLAAGQMVKVVNNQTSEIYRPYRQIPTGSAITSANPTSTIPFFRPETYVRYSKIDGFTARLSFLRNGMGTGQTEPLSFGNVITFTNLGNGLVQVATVGGSLSARTGDMMYIRPDSSPFAADAVCKSVPTDPTLGGQYSYGPEYWGYPVVEVIDSNNVVVIAPNITTFGSFALTRSTDLVFTAMMWNEKNIRSNRAEGAGFMNSLNNGKMRAVVKKLGNNMLSIFVHNSSSEAADTMKLDTMSVSTDDFVMLGVGFAVANQGTFRLVAHNGRNHIIVYHPTGGVDEIFNADSLEHGGVGSRTWGSADMYADRPIRILDGESVRIGDRLRVSSALTTQAWFPSALIGTFPIVNMGYTGYNYGTSSVDPGQLCPYVDIAISNPPSSTTLFGLGSSVGSIGFVEQAPFVGFRVATGSGVNPLDVQKAETFLVPNISSHKMSATYGTELVAMYKLGYAESQFQGIDGYKVFLGPIALAHKIIDGSPTNSVLYPGVRAAGTKIEVLPPLIKTISMSLTVYPKDGVSLDAISPVIQATVASYINGLGVGAPVILSEIISVVQSLPGVLSVSIASTLPAVTLQTPDRIVVDDVEKCLVLNAGSDVVIG